MPRKQVLKNFNIRNFPEDLKTKLKVIAAERSENLYDHAIKAVEEYVAKETK